MYTHNMLSIWIEPPGTLKHFIERSRRLFSDSQQYNFALALPPWFLFLLSDFSLPRSPARPFWLPKRQKASDMIIRRDRSSAYYSSPLFTVLPRLLDFSGSFGAGGSAATGSLGGLAAAGLPGSLGGLAVEAQGGALPDLRYFCGTYAHHIYDGSPQSPPLPLMDTDIQICAPLIWKLEGYKQADSSALFTEMKMHSRRCTIHLVKLEIEKEIGGLNIFWNSLIHIDLKQYRQ
ncbi:MAG: hypothetical protein ACR2PY_06465 [Salinispira sp.]